MTDAREVASGAGGAASGVSMLESATRMWLSGIGAFWLAPLVKAQDESTKILDLLVGLQQRASRKTSGAVPDKPDHAAATWDQLQQVFDDRVASALTRLNVPTQSDIESLQTQVNALAAALDVLSNRQAQARQQVQASKSKPKTQG